MADFNPAASEPTIGSLRWPVTIARRRQTPDSGTSILDTYEFIETVRASVTPIGDMIFYGAEQADSPVTHRIICRWLDYLVQGLVILRSTLLPTGGQRNEVFRVRRIKERNGRKRFVEILAELERISEGGLASDETLSVLAATLPSAPAPSLIGAQEVPDPADTVPSVANAAPLIVTATPPTGTGAP